MVRFCVYCDANAYDQGYVEPDQLAQSVKVIGRGGTVLQPGIQLLEKADDFPDDAPILIITDGGCDVLRVHHPHGYLIPAYGSLPFKAKGEVFRVE
ncbi:hypothetical protein [Marinicellulosiphila megalodicopiae]|uniref:hypothetical protein n=1 Tax=Marinicellulosiphila megalodicopiae TaxID=2724896 RepID=UPI003BB08C56